MFQVQVPTGVLGAKYGGGLGHLTAEKIFTKLARKNRLGKVSLGKVR